jgi:hypothetical protein
MSICVSLWSDQLTHLELTGVQIGAQKTEGVRGGGVNRIWKIVELDKSHLGGLLLVGTRISAPLLCHEAKGEAVRDVPIRVANRVGLGLRQAAERNEVFPCDLYAGLLTKLVDCGLGEAAAGLSRAGREAPGAVVGPFGQENPAATVSKGNHRSWYQHQVTADCLTQLP